MVLEITIEPEFIREVKTAVHTVHVESHRILTVCTYNDTVISKWLKETLKVTKSATILVAVMAENDTSGWHSKKKKEHPYDLFCLTTGSHTLICHYFDDAAPPSLVTFFQNPRVFAVSHHMANLSRRLKAHHGLEIRNAVDVNDLAIKGLKRDDLDLGRYDLNRLVKTVLGKNMDVVKPERVIEWFCGSKTWYLLNLQTDFEEDYFTDWDCLRSEKVKFCTADVYLLFLIGLELIDAIDGASGFKKNKNKKKK